MSLLHSIRPIIIQYVLAIANGLATFLAVLTINRLLAGRGELFSQVSTLLYLLPLFLANIDLGSHNEFLRRWPQCTRQQRGTLAAELLTLRLIFGALAVVFALIHGLVSGFSPDLLAAQVILISAMVPLALLSAYDSLQIAAGSAERAIAVRLVRIAAVTALVAGVFLWRERSLLAAPLAYTALVWLCTLVLVHPAGRALFSVGWRAAASTMRRERLVAFGIESLKNGAYSLTVFLHGTLSLSILARFVGETGLGPFNTATYMAVPFFLALQMINLVRTPVFAHVVHAGDPLALARRMGLHQRLLVSAGVIGLLGIGALAALGLVGRLFPGQPAAQVSLLALLIYLQNWLMQVATPFVTVGQMALRKPQMVLKFVIIWMISLPVMIFGVARYGIPGFVWGQLAFFVAYLIHMFLDFRGVYSWAIWQRGNHVRA
jgi:hypothetical protein